MILVDTSVWADHFRAGNRRLGILVDRQQVLGHPFVIGELACGQLPRRAQILADLAHLQAAPLADQEEVLGLIDRHQLMGTGIGWVDAHLLASTLLARGRIWTLDRALWLQARRLGLAA